MKINGSEGLLVGWREGHLCLVSLKIKALLILNAKDIKMSELHQVLVFTAK